MLKEKEGMVPAIVLTVICVVTALLLSLTNTVTKDRIAQAEANAKVELMQGIFPDADEFTALTPEKTLELATKAKVRPAENLVEVNEAKKGGNVVGYVMQIQSGGYGGPVPIMVAIDKASKTITGVAVMTNDETPGLGKKVENKNFLDQFKGKPADKEFVLKDPGAQKQKLDAVTGATITSNSVLKSINNALKVFSTVAE